MSKELKVDPAKKFFDDTVSDRERAIFEGAITLAAVYHQFPGIPISADPRITGVVEKAIKSTMELQPFKERVDVKIRTDKMKGTKKGPYDYDTLSGSALEVRVTAVYGKAKAVLAMKHIPELDYDLMFIEKVSQEE
ncbi:MAG: dihydroneopterin aldolase family protein [Promethearchaeati archaeon SRVP18_Atabeyarchaeia-1]